MLARVSTRETLPGKPNLPSSPSPPPPSGQVSVHPLMQHVPIRILKARVRSGISQPINFATVVTDFTTCHNTWFHAEATRCFVPTDFCRGLAKKNGLQDAQIVQHGGWGEAGFSRTSAASAGVQCFLRPCFSLCGTAE